MKTISQSIKDFLEKSVRGEMTVEQQVNFLKNFELTTPEEMKEAVLFFRSKQIQCFKAEEAVDVCGTGGSKKKKLNISTISALLLAGMGLPVVKHGNRAVSGTHGSFDLLEALKINFNQSPDVLKNTYIEENIAFLYAPLFHPAFKAFSEARKALGKPSFFNILGPLLNPAQVKRQIIGTPFKEKMQLIAESCRLLGSEKVFVVSSRSGLDEVSIQEATEVVELSNGKIKTYTLTPEDFGIHMQKDGRFHTGTYAHNKTLAQEILAGHGHSFDENTVLLNAALALTLVEPLSLKAAFKKVKKALHAGLGLQKLKTLQNSSQTPSILLEIAKNKQKEVAERKRKTPLAELKKNLKPSQRAASFMEDLKNKTPQLKLIAEVKLASPSKGLISKRNPIELACRYEEENVSAISVLCDKKYFSGSLSFLKTISEKTRRTPLLCKDFIIDEYQIYEARKNGADLILLIAALLSEEKIKAFLEVAKRLGMECLCEVHNEEELKKALNTKAKIIGINNRDLNTFKIDFSSTVKLVPLIPEGHFIISESGFSSAEDTEKVPRRVEGILVGTALMESANIPRAILGFKNKKAKLKICGIQTVQEAEECEKQGVDYIGLNFVPGSKRQINLATAKQIIQVIKRAKTVAVFKDQSIQYVNQVATQLKVDFVQLSGAETLEELKASKKPVIKTISLNTAKDLLKVKRYQKYAAYFLFDSKTPGSGEEFDHKLLNSFEGEFFLAGGLNVENLPLVLKTIKPLVVDTASGAESEGERDIRKIKSLTQIL